MAALASRNAILVALLMGMAHLLLKRYIMDTAALARQQGGRSRAAIGSKPSINGFVREGMGFASASPGPIAAVGADEDEKALYAFIYGKTATSTASPGPSRATETVSSPQSTSVSPPPRETSRPGPSSPSVDKTVNPSIGESRDPLDQFFMSPMGNGSMRAASVADLQGFSSLDLSGFAQLS